MNLFLSAIFAGAVALLVSIGLANRQAVLNQQRRVDRFSKDRDLWLCFSAAHAAQLDATGVYRPMVYRVKDCVAGLIMLDVTFATSHREHAEEYNQQWPDGCCWGNYPEGVQITQSEVEGRTR